MKLSDVKDAINDGATTAEEIADALGYNYGHVAKELKAMAEAGDLDRVDDTRPIEYHAPSGETTASTATPSTGGSKYDTGENDLMPVNREYEFDRYRLAGEAKFVDTDGIKRRIMANVRHRHESKNPIRVMLSGDPGTGKTELAQSIARDLDAVFMETNMSFQTTDADLLGSPQYSGDSTMWVDGTATKALLASRENTVVWLIDELNRARPQAMNALFSALDHRAAITLDGPRGGESIRGNALDLIVLATINEGPEFHGTESLDPALKSRFTKKFTLDYLPAETETELLAERTPVPEGIAERMVEVANSIRDLTQDSTSTVMYQFPGVPTRALLAWGRNAYDYDADGVENPIAMAGIDTLATYYDEDEDAMTEAETVVRSMFDGTSLDDSAFEAVETADGEATSVRYVCDECEFGVSGAEAEEMGLVAMPECPECGANLRGIEDDPEVSDIPGVGRAKAENLRDAGFGDVAALRRASQTELAAVDGIGNALAARIKAEVGEPEGLGELFG